MLRSIEQREARQGEMKAAMEAAPREVAFQEHFDPRELAALWKFSPRTVKRIAAKFPGVVRLGTARPGKRSHITLRIPASVAKQIYATLTGEIEKPGEKKPPASFRPKLVKRKSIAP